MDEADPEAPRVVVANAVLAGIAAADAVCCLRLGRHAAGDDHDAAADLLGEAVPPGSPASRALAELLAIKSKAHYSAEPVRAAQARAAVQRAETLVGLATRAARTPA